MAFQVTLNGPGEMRVTVVPAAGVGMGFLVSTVGPGEIIPRSAPHEKSLLSMSYLVRVEYSTPGTGVWKEVPIMPLVMDPSRRTFEAKVASGGTTPTSTALISIIMMEGGGPGSYRETGPATPTIIQNFYDCCDCEEGKKPRKPKDKSEIIDQTPIQQYFRD